MFPDPAGQEAVPVERSSDVIYKTIRQLIVSGTMRPWTRLVEEDVAKEFNMSRSPVREALRRLEYDGLVRLLRRGNLVSVPISDEEREELHLMRLAIDRLAARLGCKRVTPEGWAEARQAVERIGDAITADGITSPSFALAHLEAHATIHRLSFHGNVTSAISQQLLSYTTFSDSAYPNDPSLPPVEQHLKLIDELSSGSVKRAVAAVEKHARRGYAGE